MKEWQDLVLEYGWAYGRESVDQRYSFVRILEKPVVRQVLEGVFGDTLTDVNAAQAVKRYARAN